MAAAISSRLAFSRSVTISSIGWPGNNSTKACSLAASSSGRRTAYFLAVFTGAAGFFHRSSKGLNFTSTPPYRTITTGYYSPRGHFISAQSSSRIFAYSSRALGLVWSTNKSLSIALGLLTLVAGVLPAGVAYVGAQIVDAVIHAAD